MKCYGHCEHSIIQSEEKEDKIILKIYCEHLDFVLPPLVAEGLEDYLREKSIDWKPHICPLRGGE